MQGRCARHIIVILYFIKCIVAIQLVRSSIIHLRYGSHKTLRTMIAPPHDTSVRKSAARQHSPLTWAQALFSGAAATHKPACTCGDNACGEIAIDDLHPLRVIVAVIYRPSRVIETCEVVLFACTLGIGGNSQRVQEMTRALVEGGNCPRAEIVLMSALAPYDSNHRDSILRSLREEFDHNSEFYKRPFKCTACIVSRRSRKHAALLRYHIETRNISLNPERWTRSYVTNDRRIVTQQIRDAIESAQCKREFASRQGICRTWHAHTSTPFDNVRGFVG